jgi:tetratricopeptide (TPR) repeat protein
VIVPVRIILAFACVAIALPACAQNASSSESAEARNQLEHAKQLVMQGRFAAGASALQELLKSSPGSPLIYNLLGYCYVQQHINDRAVESFKQAVALDPAFKAAHRNLGGLYLLEGRLQESIGEFSVVIRLDPSDAQSHFDLGRAELAAGNSKSGVLQLETAHELTPHDMNVGLALARAYQENHEFGAAIKTLNEMGTQDLAEWHAIFGYSSFRSGHPKDAVAELQKAMDLDPRNQDYVLELSEVFLMHYNPPAAIALLDAARQAFPNSARVWFALGVAKLLNDNLADAEPALRTSLELDPKLDLAYVVLGQGYLEAGQWNDLLRTAQTLNVLNPRNAAGYYYEAMVLLKTQSSEQPQNKIESLLRKATELDPADPNSRYELAKVLVARGDKRNALAELESIVRVNPEFGPAYYHLYRLYRESGETEKSRQAEQQYQRLRAGRGEAVQKLVVEIRQSRGGP